MKTKRSQEGYFLVDHRAAPGLGVPLVCDDPLPSTSTTFHEGPTYTCSHCQRIVVLNPLRRRERGYCPKCDHYVCDGCEVARVATGGLCRTVKQIIDEVKERAVKGLPVDDIVRSFGA